MRVAITIEQRFNRTPDGAVWTPTSFAYPFWNRYLSVFTEVQIIARVREVAGPELGWKRADGKNVSVTAVPYYLGPQEFVAQLHRIIPAIRRAIPPEDAVILRLGSQIGTIAAYTLHRSGQPYGVEVLTDPFDAFVPGAIRHPLRPVLRQWLTCAMRTQCAKACAASYVTSQALQARYPCPAFMIGVSDVELGDDAFAAGPRLPLHSQSPLRLITVASLAQLYKGIDTLLDAIALCFQAGIPLHLTIVGDGKYRGELEARAARLGLTKTVRFLGQLPAGQPVREQLDYADLFVLPSKTEGLPRAMVEAMARGLPVIGTAVGGIPELLEPEELVPPGDVAALSAVLCAVAVDSTRLATMATKNLAVAAMFRDDALRERRERFYREVRMKTAAWQNTHSARAGT